MGVAAPRAGLLTGEGALAFETSSWSHLLGYFGKIQGAPASIAGGSRALDEALAQARSAAARFGSADELRGRVRTGGGAWMEDASQPTLFATIAWIVAHLQRSAAAVAVELQRLEGARDAGTVNDQAGRLGKLADEARHPIASWTPASSATLREVEPANALLLQAFNADVENLRRLQEEVGAAGETVRRLASAKRKGPELERARRDLEELERRAGALRAGLAPLEAILGESHWLPRANADLTEFFDRLRRTWTTFGSGVTRSIADSTDAQLEDAQWVARTFGLEEAIVQWEAIAAAAGRFVAVAVGSDPKSMREARESA